MVPLFVIFFCAMCLDVAQESEQKNNNFYNFSSMNDFIEDIVLIFHDNCAEVVKCFCCDSKKKSFDGEKMKLMMVFNFVSGCWMNMIAVAVAFVSQFSSAHRNLRVKSWNWELERKFP